MMKMRVLSLMLAGLMAMSALAACDNGDVNVDEGDGSQQQEVQGDGGLSDNGSDDQGSEGLGSEEVVSDVNVTELNVHLPIESEPSAVETVEKVLKLTVDSEGGTPAKQMIINIDEIMIPAGSIFEYDVYLETDAVGMGICDIRFGSFYLASSGAIDDGGVGVNVESDNVSDYALGRWYHREFDIPVTETVNSKMIRFGVGNLAESGTSVCYYDNIRIKDADGNVIFEADEDFIANYEIRQGKGLTCTFEVVDDPAPTVARKNYDEFKYIHEVLGQISDADKIDFAFTADSAKSEPALYIGDADSSCLYGIRGYILSAKDGYLTLYRSSETVEILASQRILGFGEGKDGTMRLEVDGNVVRGYWLDDLDGVEPWPEFELAVDGLVGKNYGIMDVFGFGYFAKTVSVGKCEQKTLENSYVNPVILDSADPDILYYDGVYYLYNTSAGYKVYTSADLVNWEYKCETFDPVFTWSDEPKGWQWAPDVEYYNGKFYMICSIDEQLGIAVADSPLGPFIPAENRFFTGTIDGHLFIDDDGQAYLYYVSWREGVEYGIYCSKIDLETLELDYSSEVQVIKVTEQFERYHDYENRLEENGVTEGPYMLKHNGLYYLTYSGSDYESTYYAVGYGVSESPMGPFVKYEGNPIHIGNAAILGTAHHCFVKEGESDEFLIFYHNHVTTETIHPRSACVDRARFAPTESGIDRLETYGPTTVPQAMPLS